VGLAGLAPGATALVLDRTQRNASGYLMTDTTAYSTGTNALVSDSNRTGAAGDVRAARDLLGTGRIHTESSTPDQVVHSVCDPRLGALGRARVEACHVGRVGVRALRLPRTVDPSSPCASAAQSISPRMSSAVMLVANRSSSSMTPRKSAAFRWASATTFSSIVSRASSL
jgi:hypothetical protein